MNIPTKLLKPAAKLPFRAHRYDAGADLHSVDTCSLAMGERRLIKTGLSIAIPAGYYGRVADRSGLAVKNGVHVLGGVIDHGYTGEVGVVLINLGEQTFTVNEGDRVAQLIIEQCHEAEWQETWALPDTERGAGGFGSSGT